MIICNQALDNVLTFNVEKKADGKEYDCPSEDLIDSVEQAVLSPALVGEDNGHAHDPDKPGKYEIGNSETVPFAVLKEPVTTSAIVDKDHYHQGEARR